MKYSICILALAIGLSAFKVNAQAQRQTSIKPSESTDGLVRPRMRVIIDNDFGGDPDGLFQLVHQVLSPSAEIRAIVGSHLKKGDPFDPSNQTATNAKKKAEEILGLMESSGRFPVYEGSNIALSNDTTAQHSPAAQAIINEAMRTDTDLPLYVICGAGLTDLASAYLLQPKIAEHLTLIWIGGPEYAGLATPPPGYTSLEYNLGIDITAAKVIFNWSAIPIWQVPRNTYRQALMPYSELLLKVKPKGKTGKYLAAQIEGIMKMTAKFNLKIGETYIMGDSPLVLLTALQSSFEADPSSSQYVTMRAPLINSQGLYEVNNTGRNIRVYTQLDTRLLFEDFFAKLSLFHQK